MAELKLEARRGGQAGGVVLLNGTVDTGYSLLQDPDWGTFSTDPVIATNQHGVGGAVGGTIQPRTVVMPIRLRGSSKAALVTFVQALGREVEQIYRSGGRLRWKSNNVTYPIYLNVMAAQLALPQGWHWEMHNRTDGVLTLICEPAGYGDSTAFNEDFSPRTDGTSGLTDLTLDAGAGTLSIGVITDAVRPRSALVPSSTVQKRFRHTARGWTYTDAAVTWPIRVGAIPTALDFGCGIFDASGNGLAARIVGAATNQLQVCTLAGGVPTSIATAAFTPAANATYWVRFRREGPMAFAQVFSTAPGLATVATAECAIALTAAQQQANPGAQAGGRVVPVATDERYLGFDVRSYSYLGAQPDTLRLSGIPGDLPAFAEIEIGQPAAVATQLLWGMAAWDDRARDPNLVWNGGANDNPNVVGTQGWSTAVVANIITVASTSVARQTGAAKYGNSCLEFVSTITANSGVGFQLNRRFKRARPYVALGWLQSAAGVGQAQIVLGNTTEGSPAASTAVALNTTFAFHQCVWTPTADRDVATIGVRHVTGSVETTRYEVGVYEASPVTLSANIASAGATTCTITAPPPEGWEWYKARLGGGQVVALVDNEIMRVEAIDATTGTLTLGRGFDGTTAATHSSGATVYLLDLYTPHLDGSHFAGGIDVAGAASPWLLSPATSTINNPDANTRSGAKVTTTTAITSQAWYFLIDPATILPLEFEQDRVLLEVWGRFAYDPNIPGLRISLATGGEDPASIAAFDLETGTAGLSHSAGSAVFRYSRLGLLALRYQDGPNRRRQSIIVTASWTSTGFAFSLDYLQLVRPGRRVMLPTGQDSTVKYPALMAAASKQITRRIYPDLTSEATLVDTQLGEHQLAGGGAMQGGWIGGQAIVLPTPNADLSVKASTQIPNQPTAPTTSELYHAQQLAVAVNIIPRFRTIR